VAVSGTPGRPRRGAPRRQFYSIGEVCEILALKPHVLRYWETQFAELSPAKNRAGNRVYRAEEIELAALIKRLVHDERYTIDGARQRIAELRAAGAAAVEGGEVLNAAFVRMLRDELEALAALLEPTPPRPTNEPVEGPC
jgi:DNA-binding transcriptional MerR regulator